MNATGLRDTPLRMYARSNNGSDGFVRSIFTYAAWWWGRVDETSVTVRANADKLQMKLDAVAEVADEAVVPVGGILKNDVSGDCWWIRGINPVRQTRRQVIGLERISEEQLATFTLYEGASTLDGVHLVEPAT